LEQIVAIVTPFGRQVREIRDACANRKILVEGREGMTIGTVHALQGAERPVVIFSPVYSKHADGGFIDVSPSMLNVMVSRAKDSCLVFGDMDVMAAAKTGSPRAILSGFLFASERNALEFAAEPRADLKQGSGQLRMLRDAAGHDAFLLDAFSQWPPLHYCKPVGDRIDNGTCWAVGRIRSCCPARRRDRRVR
jgi:hypothetical protein